MPDSAHINPKPEFESDEPVLRQRETAPEKSMTQKDRMFASPEAIAFEKGTVAEFDNQNIVRSKDEDVNLPDVDSNFPSREQTIPLPELQDGGEYR